jgi:hypothetical protein
MNGCASRSSAIAQKHPHPPHLVGLLRPHRERRRSRRADENPAEVGFVGLCVIRSLNHFINAGRSVAFTVKQASTRL